MSSKVKVAIIGSGILVPIDDQNIAQVRAAAHKGATVTPQILVKGQFIERRADGTRDGTINCA
jgi:hypothetical protein